MSIPAVHGSDARGDFEGESSGYQRLPDPLIAARISATCAAVTAVAPGVIVVSV